MTDTAFLCPVCGSPSQRMIEGNVDDATFFSGEQHYLPAAGRARALFDVFVCGLCGHGFSPVRSPHLVAAWYERAPLDDVFLRDRKARIAMADRLLSRLEDLAHRRGKLLDVGSGPGFLLQAAAARGWNAVGLEPSAAYESHARERLGMTTLHQPIEAWDRLMPAGFDAVTALDVIEHLPDPRVLFRAARRALAPGGFLAITTPRFDSVLARFGGRRWYCIFPAHLHYFTAASLRLLAETEGWGIVAQRTFIRRLSVASLLRRAFGIETPRAFEKLSVPVPLGDALEVVFTRS